MKVTYFIRFVPSARHFRLPAALLPTIFLLAAVALPLGGRTGTVSIREPKAPPPPPPILERTEAASSPSPVAASASGQILYSIGEPTDAEQEYVEFVNRARANPQAEAQRFKETDDPDVVSAYQYYDVDLDLMVSQFAEFAPAQPLAVHSKLITAARRQSEDMATNGFQGHTGSDGSTVGDRLTDAGYSFSRAGENVYSYSESVWYGHAGFEVDWGTAVGGGSQGGMQDPPGHRLTIHDGDFREIGVGVVEPPSHPDVGPQVVTQVLADRGGSTPLVTGVAYYDLDRNGRYGAGEGIEGVTVTVDGSDYYAITSRSGGYAVPVPGDGSYTVTFSGSNLEETRSITVADGQNVKVDLIPPAPAPVVSGPVTLPVDWPSHFDVSQVALAEAVRWRRTRRVSYSYVEGAENGETYLEVDASAGYNVIQGQVKAAGANAFHLAHPEPELQSIRLKRLLLPGASSELKFRTRMRTATADQVAKAQVSVDGGATWQSIWTQAGSGGSGESSFSSRAISLADFAGKEVEIRFIFDLLGGSYYPQTEPDVGFYLDEIAVTSAGEVVDEVLQDLPVDSIYSFTPSGNGVFRLQAASRSGGRWRLYGDVFQMVATGSNVGPSITRGPRPAEVSAGDTFTLEVWANGTGPLAYQWLLDGQPLAGETERVLTVTSARTADRGSYSVRVTGTAEIESGAAVISVTGAGPTTFAEWQNENFSSAEREDPSISGPGADPGSRGTVNLLRYAFVLDEAGPMLRDLPAVRWQEGQAQPLEFIFRRRKEASDLYYHVEGSTDLRGWQAVEVNLDVLSEEGEAEIVRARPVASVGSSFFLRLRVELLE